MDRNMVVEIGSAVRAGAQLAFGEKVEVGGSSVLPVAVALYGFGGGSEGAGGSEKEPAAGGGGGGFAVPVGAYVSDGGAARFEPNIVALAAVSIPLTCAAGWAVSRIVRALRR